jgi:C-terminal processing protease CtpA/Prc
MIKYIGFFVVLFIFASCGDSENCDNQDQKEFVYDVMHDSYLWADDVPVLTKEQIKEFKDDEALLKKLISPKDKSRKGQPFTHIMSKKDHDDFFEAGKIKGFGYLPSLVDENKTTEAININFVYPNSPADKAGLKRGDLIATFDGNSIYKIRRDKALFDKYFIDSNISITTHLKLRDGQEVDIAKKEFDLKTVLHKEIIEQNGTKIGYIVFQSFIGTAQKELDESFAYFKQQHIDELVLDIRYNGGGYVYLANHLGVLIGGDRVAKTVFNKSELNNKYKKYNETEYFEKTSKNSLNLSRVFIITTADSCSASELVINSLKSRTNSVEVVQVGDATCGKPYAMLSMPYCDKYILPVQMRSVNGDGFGDYATGLKPDCKAVDDISRDFGDKDEDSLANALYYIQNNSCKVAKKSKSIEIKSKSLLSGFRGMYGIF